MIECKVRALYCQLYPISKTTQLTQRHQTSGLLFRIMHLWKISPSAFSWSTLHICGSLAYREYILAAMHHDVQEGAHFGKLTAGLFAYV